MRTYSTDHAARIATAETLPPKAVSRWFRFGASGAKITTTAGDAVRTSTAMAAESGMRLRRNVSSSFSCMATRLLIRLGLPSVESATWGRKPPRCDAGQDSRGKP